MLKLKSLKEPTNPEDDLRILIARYRYLPKNKQNWHQWWKCNLTRKSIQKLKLNRSSSLTHIVGSFLKVKIKKTKKAE
ncbi:MAG: hypothetical protein WAJ93_28115 [Candidatus Nitrosopolaris sp.]